jgi:hypothetical protein
VRLSADNRHARLALMALSAYHLLTSRNAYSITSSARVSVGGIARPIALAVLLQRGQSFSHVAAGYQRDIENIAVHGGRSRR